MNKKTNKLAKITSTLLVIIVSVIGLAYYSNNENIENKISYEISNIPAYNGKIYIEINNNIPEFRNEDFNIEKYGMAMIKTNWEKANSDEEKNNYSWINPSGFIQEKYETNIVPGGYLYHRCHLIGWNIGGIDVDKRNLITGTRDFNVEGMKTFEDKVYNYLK